MVVAGWQGKPVFIAKHLVLYLLELLGTNRAFKITFLGKYRFVVGSQYFTLVSKEM